MKPEKEYRSYVNYFQKWEGAGITGLSMAAVGFLFLWLGFSFASYIIAIVLMLLGLGLFFYGSIGRAHENDLQNQIDRAMTAIEFKELEEDTRHFFRRVPKTPEIREFSGYGMREGLLIKRQKNGSLCSSEYTCAKIFFLTDAFYIKTSTFSFISDEKKKETHEILFDTLEDVTVERDRISLTSGKNSFLAKTCQLCIHYDGGKRLLLPAKDDIYTDEFANDLKRKLLNQA